MNQPDSVGARSIAVRDTHDFQGLRRSFLSFIVPMTALFLVWYLLYVILAGFAPGFFAIKLVGNINVGLVFGLGQVVSTFAITMAYRSWADKKYDPRAEAIRHEMETGEVFDDQDVSEGGER
jgi:uncharacterized membrane protein (DUF485 family)